MLENTILGVGVSHIFLGHSLIEVGNFQSFVAFIQHMVVRFSSIVGLGGYGHYKSITGLNHLLLLRNSIRRRSVMRKTCYFHVYILHSLNVKAIGLCVTEAQRLGLSE